AGAHTRARGLETQPRLTRPHRLPNLAALGQGTLGGGGPCCGNLAALGQGTLGGGGPCCGNPAAPGQGTLGGGGPC
uniref:hypothetical protein n=1 Tax=Arthrobacter sp. TaxID=1667 RepID=UPI0035C671BC